MSADSPAGNCLPTRWASTTRPNSQRAMMARCSSERIFSSSLRSLSIRGSVIAGHESELAVEAGAESVMRPGPGFGEMLLQFGHLVDRGIKSAGDPGPVLLNR